MRQMTKLLVYAALLIAYGHANPYSRISNPHSDVYDQYSDKTLGVNKAATEAQLYSSASSSSFSGYTSAASQSANKITLGVVHPGVDELKSQITNLNSQQKVNTARADHNGQNYWWMNDNSPFKLNVQSSSGGASAGGASVGINNNKDNSDKDDHRDKSGDNIHSNPFLQGNINVVDSVNSKNQHDISKNPFFNGVASSGVSSSASSTSTKLHSIPNQFQQNYNTNFEGIQKTSEREHDNGYFVQSINQENNKGGLSVSCSGNGKICVAKNLCINGYVSGSVRGLTQIKSDDQLCDIDSEVCCNLKNSGLSSAADQVTAGTQESASHFTNQVNRYETVGGFQSQYQNFDSSNQNNGGIFGQFSNQQHGIDDQTLDDNSNGYLPPIGSEPSSNIPAFSNPPKAEVQSDNIPSQSAPAPTHVQLGCAAALICVEEQYCGMDGMISPTSLTLSSEQLIRRVPLSDCKNPDNGIIGKCCRDPNYVDPWPTGNLPANYTGGFDEQGFPTFLNIQRTRPTKKPTGSPVKGGLSHIKNNPQIPVTPAPMQRAGFSPPTFPPQFANIPNQISQGFANLFNGNPFRPSTIAPPTSGIKEESTTVNIPVSTTKPFSNFPNLPNFSNPFNKNKFDESSSNTNPIVISPQVFGVQCGIKNSVQRSSSGLNDVDVGFGEIPWEAMILSNREKKLLCSGAIIAPNAVITAAGCINGAEEISIKAGEWKLGYELKHEEPLAFEIVQVKSIIKHPGYQPNHPAHDMAILMLEHPVTFDQHIGTICIGEHPLVSQGAKCISTGWGKHVLQSHLAGAIMHSINIDIINKQECQQRLLNAETQIELDDSLICAKAQKQNNNMCQVDLGGPLACDRGDGIYELMGVYNQDTGCLPTNQVATFSIIDNSWIQYVMTNPPKIELELNAPVETSPIHVPQIQSRKDEPCDCQKSVLSPENNQYLPPV
ncbi:hypothetical protein PV325_008794 [Microctonus aethiopoides]|nr:hypothetical protein PV325_008794 [Microctonus aethiopoides]